MNINKHFLRVVVLTILVSILMTIISPLGQCVCYADDTGTTEKFSVSFDTPVWSYDKFYYSNVDVQKKADDEIKSISVHVENGYIYSLPTSVTKNGSENGKVEFTVTANNGRENYSTHIEETNVSKFSDFSAITWTTDELYELDSNGKPIVDTDNKQILRTIDGKRIYQTATCSFTDGFTIEKINSLIMGIKFLLLDYGKAVKITIDVDSRDYSSLSGYNITRGTRGENIDLSDHYYMYVNEKLLWADAYYKAKNMSFMGMPGYLVTVMSAEEDKILDNITSDGAWAGAAMVKVNLTDQVKADAKDNTKTAEWLSSPTDPYNDYAWMWVDGDEAGIQIDITDGYVVNRGVTNPGRETDGKPNYSNWNKNPEEEGKTRPYEGDEPNCNYYGNPEYCMQVHYTSQGQEEKTTAGWNDLPNEQDGFVSGYFVEFSGDDPFPSSHVTESKIQPHHETRDWDYIPNTDKDEVTIVCNNPDHEECIYKETTSSGEINPDYRPVVLSIDVGEKMYNTLPNDEATVSFTETIGTDKREISEDEYIKFGVTGISSVKYVSTDGKGYDSTTPPTNAGEYVAYIEMGCHDTVGPRNIIVKKAFTISQVPLEITLNDQKVYVGDDIKRNYDTISSGDHVGLIKEITLNGTAITSISELAGETGSKDKLASILDTAIVPDDTAVKAYPVGYKSDNVASKMINITKNNSGTYVDNIVIMDASETKDVTGNYKITVNPGNIEVTKRPTKRIDIADNPKAESITYGEKLENSNISGNCCEIDDESEVVEGEFSWTTPTVMPNVSDSKKTEYKVTFTPKDGEKYFPIDDIPLEIEVLPKNLPDNIKNKNGEEIGITNKISVDVNNNPVVELYDKQTQKELEKGDGKDYTVSSETVTKDDKQQIKITIKGNNNYTEKYTVYVDAHVWDGILETQVVPDSLARSELSNDKGEPPSASPIKIENGKKMLLYNVNQLSGSGDVDTAKTIVSEINGSKEHTSANGTYHALVTLNIENVDSILSKDEQNETAKKEKQCVEDAIGKTGTGKVSVPANAVIGLFFDVSMDIQYEIIQQNPSTKTLITKDATNPDVIRDTTAKAFGDDFAGFKETVTITVPERLRPQKGYTRTYYIIRAHETSAGNYEWDVLPVTREGYKLSFDTDKFSKYALAYTETKDPEKKPDEPSGDSGSSSSGSSGSITPAVIVTPTMPTVQTTVQVVSPKTGDKEDMTAATILVVFGMTLLYFTLRKRGECGE